MSSDEILVKLDEILACISCNICKDPYQEATTINECLHTFCRKCIYTKLKEEGIKTCPECTIDLGVDPLSKLRPNKILQELTDNVFPPDQKKRNNNGEVKVTGQATHSAFVPAKKEGRTRSLASLTISSPRVVTSEDGRGQSSIPLVRRKVRGARSTKNKPAKKYGDFTDEYRTDSSTSLEHINKYSQGTRRNSTIDGQSVESFLEIQSTDDFHTSKGRTGASQSSISVPTGPFVEPRSSSFKTSNRHDALKSSSMVATRLSVNPTLDKGKGKMPQTSSMQQVDAENPLDCQAEEVKKPKAIEIVNISDSDDSTPPKAVSPKKVRRLRRKTKHFSDIKMPAHPQAVVNSSTFKPENPIWFCLFAEDDREEGSRPLPQIPAKYLKIEDDHAPVSSIHTYLKAKLELQSEDELDIWCGGTKLDPKLPLNNALEGWLQTRSRERASVTIGSSTEDFMILLHYAWRRN